MQNTILELQTGQVSFISGLMAGFALTVAVHILRHSLQRGIERIVFILLIVTTLLFLLALYVDVRLTIELVGVQTTSPEAQSLVSAIRAIGTGCATVAYVLFVFSIGLLGWIERPRLGVITSAVSGAVLITLTVIWFKLLELQSLLQ